MPRARLAAAVTMVGGVVIIVAGAFKWASAQGPNGTGKLTGGAAGYVAGAIIAAFGLWLWNRGFFRGAKTALWVLAVLNAVWTALLYGALDQSAKDLTGPGSTYTVSAGFYILVAGAVVVVAAAVIGTTAPKAAAAPSAPPAAPVGGGTP
jgi:hypothetical protein